MRDDRILFNLDPENKYPSDGPRGVERNANKILVMLMELNMEKIRNFTQIDFSGEKANEVSSFLPGSAMERTRDCIQIDFGGEEGIVILITPEAIELRLPTIEWISHWPAKSSKFWKRVEVTKIIDGELETLLKEALKERQKQFKNCRFCKRYLPPEHMHDNDVCQGCAEKYLGVKY